MHVRNTRRCAQSSLGDRKTPMAPGTVGSLRFSDDHMFWLTF